MTQHDEQVNVGDEGSMTMAVWTPESGTGPGMLLIQEIFGVGPYIRAVGERLAAAGYVVGAPDLFWRFAPGFTSGHDEAGLGESMQQAAKLDPAKAVTDCVAALEQLAALADSSVRPGVIGFCLGGTLAFGTAAADDPSVCISYYGAGVPGMIDQLGAVRCPTLFHFGAADAYIPAEGVEALAGALPTTNGAVMVVNVEAAGHAFDNHEAPMFYDEGAATAAWAKTMAFLAEHHPA